MPKPTRSGAGDLKPGLHVFDPYGHAILVGEPGQFDPSYHLPILATGGEINVGSAVIRDPDVVDQLADRLHLIAQRMRAHYAPRRPQPPEEKAMTTLTVTEATKPHWCAFCPDSIQPGELDATAPDFTGPDGDEGHAHADCAEHKGYDLIGDTAPPTASAALWKALRDGIRDRGGRDADDNE